MITPFEGGKFRVTSIIGYRDIPELGMYRNAHYGLDIVGVSSDNITAVAAGTVGFAGCVPKSTGDATWEWGNYVRVDSPGGVKIYYCHMARTNVRTGDKVGVGTILGVEGATGQVTGVHLHIEMRVNGKQCALPASASDAANVATLIGITNATGVYTAPDPIDEIIEAAGLSGTWKAPMTRYQAQYPYGYEFWRKIAEALK